MDNFQINEETDEITVTIPNSEDLVARAIDDFLTQMETYKGMIEQSGKRSPFIIAPEEKKKINFESRPPQ